MKMRAGIAAALWLVLASPVFAQYGEQPPTPDDCHDCAAAPDTPLNASDGGQPDDSYDAPIDSGNPVDSDHNQRQCAVLARILAQQATNEELRQMLRNRGCE